MNKYRMRKYLLNKYTNKYACFLYYAKLFNIIDILKK